MNHTIDSLAGGTIYEQLKQLMELEKRQTSKYLDFFCLAGLAP